MLQPPDIDREAFTESLRSAWAIDAEEIAFLPVGADPDAAAWRVSVSAGPRYFLKTRFRPFDPVALLVPHYLHQTAGIMEVLAPIPTRDGSLATASGAATLILYPYVEGRDGFEAALTIEGWAALGATMRRIHDTELPAALAARIGTEQFGPRWRDTVRRFLGEAAAHRGDSVATRFATLLDARRNEIALIVQRAAELADMLCRRRLELVLCHTDIHAGNVLLGGDGAIHIVDWDSPRLAPRERDLMFVGGGVGGMWNDDAEAANFYAGYGETTVDRVALAYYRYERIVEDIAVACEQILRGEGDHRDESLAQFAAQWRPRDVIAIAHATYARLGQVSPI